MRRKILNVFLFVAIAMIILFFAFSSFNPVEDNTLTTCRGLSVTEPCRLVHPV